MVARVDRKLWKKLFPSLYLLCEAVTEGSKNIVERWLKRRRLLNMLAFQRNFLPLRLNGTEGVRSSFESQFFTASILGAVSPF